MVPAPLQEGGQRQVLSEWITTLTNCRALKECRESQITQKSLKGGWRVTFLTSSIVVLLGKLFHHYGPSILTLTKSAWRNTAETTMSPTQYMRCWSSVNARRSIA